MNPADLPIRVRLEWPAGIIQYGSATKPNVQEFERDGKQYVAVTAELDPPFDHLAHAQAAIDHLDTQETTMSAEYTADDFKNAKFAQHDNGKTAVRWDENYHVPWHTLLGNRLSDAEMAAAGWRPVVEVEDPEAIVALVGSQAKRIRELVVERETAPLSLDTLREAWENAEITTERAPLRRGDTAITQIRPDTYTVGSVLAGMDMEAPYDVRVLSRAPRREPWADLADALRGIGRGLDGDDDYAELLAQNLHERGVRVVTGGDES